MNSSSQPVVEFDWLKRWTLYSPTAVALIEGKKSFSYARLLAAAQNVAAYLANDLNLKKGDRLAVLAGNHVETVVLFFACQRLGITLVPLNYRLSQKELAEVIADAEPALLIIEDEFAGLVGNSFRINVCTYEDIIRRTHDSDPIEHCYQVEVEFSDIALLLYTSGTTGRPKGVMISYGMIFWNSINTTLRLQLTQNDLTISFLPFFHTGAWNVLLMPLLHRGGCVVLIDKFDAADVLAAAENYGAALLFGVPTTFRLMAEDSGFPRANLSKVRCALVGGEPIAPALIDVWHGKGIPVRQGYGLTEFGPNVFSLCEKDSLRKIGSIGFPNFYVHAKIVDDTGSEILDSRPGELILQGPVAASGYWRAEKATREVFRGSWVHTGDIVRRDEEGFFYVVGRKKDMYISGGENIYPAEIEQVLRLHPKVSDAAVIGIKDEKWGEVGQAFIVLRDETWADADELLGFCRGRLAKFKLPKKIAFLPVLPKSENGKVMKQKLREENRCM